MSKHKPVTIYADGLSKIQFSSGNIKLSFFESDDNSTEEQPNNVEMSNVLQLILPVESVIKTTTELSKFIKELIDTKKIAVNE